MGTHCQASCDFVQFIELKFKINDSFAKKFISKFNTHRVNKLILEPMSSAIHGQGQYWR